MATLEQLLTLALLSTQGKIELFGCAHASELEPEETHVLQLHKPTTGEDATYLCCAACKDRAFTVMKPAPAGSC